MSDFKSFDPPLHAATGWRRWEMSDFDKQRDQQGQTLPQSALPGDVVTRLEELGQSIRAKAQQEGYKAGYAAGRAEGYEAGKTEGKAAGHKQGQDEGVQAGHKQGLKQAAAEAARLSTMAESCAQSLAAIESEVGQALINLAVNIARQVVRSTLDAQPDKILDTVRDILNVENGREAALRLRVHPDDLSLIQEHLASDPAAARWRLVADESLERGGCIAETALGDIDATLQTRWQRVASTLGQHHPWKSAP